MRLTSNSTFLTNSQCYRYESALRTLQHVLLLAPQNPFYVLQAAETAYTSGDVPLAARFFLMVIDMTDDPDIGDAQARTEAVPEGISVRAWFGLKQVRTCKSLVR